MKARALIVVLLLLFALAFVGTVSAQDADSDGIPDATDNCTLVANPSQFDADGDNFGNACDCDYDQNDLCGLGDFDIFLSCFGLDTGIGGGPPDDPDCEESDQDENLFVGLGDVTLFLAGFGSPPGPAGGACPYFLFKTTAGSGVCGRTSDINGVTQKLLDCGSLYLGGGNSVQPPSATPAGATNVLDVADCTDPSNYYGEHFIRDTP